MPISHAAALELWSAALAEEVGIAVKTDNRRALSNQLYFARQRSGNPAFANISIHLPPAEDEIWLVKREAPNGKPSGRTFEESDLESL